MRLKYNENNQFRILQFTDLHLDAKPYDEAGQQTFKLLDDAMINLQPDLVIFTGDMIWSYQMADRQEVFKDLIQCLNQHAVPVAMTYGNHDAEDVYTNADFRELEKGLRFPASKTNIHYFHDRQSYTLEVRDRVGRLNKHVLYVIDSGSYPLSNQSAGVYAWVYPEQVNWFRELAQSYQRPLHYKADLLFQHIPLPEYHLALDKIEEGEANEAVCAPELNSGLFLAMYETGQLGAMFCGHDHDNNYMADYYGIKLTYGQKSGYNAYGSFEPGVRVIDLTDEGIKTNTLGHSDFKDE